jgi:hypothetical protein
MMNGDGRERKPSIINATAAESGVGRLSRSGKFDSASKKGSKKSKQ